MGMVRSLFFHSFVAGWIIPLVAVALCGCQTKPISTPEMTANQSLVADKDALRVVEEKALHVTCAAPANYQRLRTDRNLIYTHQQWRSLTRNAGFGVVYIHTLLPINSDVLLWLAKSQYANKQKPDEGHGKLLTDWTDSLNRHWFEVENNRYHVRGYAMSQGLDNWIVYYGWRTHTPATDKEKQTIQDAVDSVSPVGAK